MGGDNELLTDSVDSLCSAVKLAKLVSVWFLERERERGGTMPVCFGCLCSCLGLKPAGGFARFVVVLRQF